MLMSSDTVLETTTRGWPKLEFSTNAAWLSSNSNCTRGKYTWFWGKLGGLRYGTLSLSTSIIESLWSLAKYENPDWDGLPTNQMSTSLKTDNLIFWV
jgi:hypothetical protein